MDTKYCFEFLRLGRVWLMGCAVAWTVSSAFAQAPGGSDFDQEERFIEALQQARMPDIAEDVIAEARKRFTEATHPGVVARLKVCEIRGQLSLGKFDDVKKIIAAISDKNGTEYWALTLALADSYYAFEKYPDADKLYLEFFKKVTKPNDALLKFYRESAGKYVMMLLRLNREKDALQAYRYLLSVPLEEDLQRRAMAEMAELMLKLAPTVTKAEERTAFLKEAEALTDKLLWKQDIWFGKAVVMKAHIALLRNDTAGAKALVENYMPQLKTIHDALKEEDPDGTLDYLRLSPMPQCRYLLAKMLLETAVAETKVDKPNEDKIKDLLLGERDPQTKKRKGDGAFNHFLNVFIRFPESQWAADAGEQTEKIRKLIKDRYQADLPTQVTQEQLAKVRQQQYQNARLAFSNNDFKSAIKRYLPVLNQFPETIESIGALGDLGVSYINESSSDPSSIIYADTVIQHIAERFSPHEKFIRTAGDQVRRLADYYGEVQKPDKRREAYAAFFANFPTHYAAGNLIMNFGERDYQAKNYASAMAYFKQIAATYTNSIYYFNALNRIAMIEAEQGNHTGEIQALEFMLERYDATKTVAQGLITAKYRLACAQRDYAALQSKEFATNAAPETVEAFQKEMTVLRLKAVKGFDDVIKRLTENQAAYQTKDDEKAANETIKEAAYFTKASVLAQMNYPVDRIPVFRKMAIAAYEDYVKVFPKGRFAARAQLQVGTIYTSMQDMEKAQVALEKLNREYGSSDEAKNSVPMLAASLIDMGLRAEGVAKYRQMFSAGGNYTDSQFLAAASALEDAKEYEMALQAYERVVGAAKDETTVAHAKLGRARILVKQKKYAEARKQLDEFIKKYDKMMIVVDANLLLVDAASEEGKTERNDIERTKLFNIAVDALKMVKNYRKDEVLQKELDLAAGDILIRKMDAENKLGLKEKAADTRGKAIVMFQGLIFSINTKNEKLAPVLESAYFKCLPLMLEHKKYKETEDDCNSYLQLFPEGRYRTDVQNWLNQAKIGQ